ncbi:MAG: hypothetical protein AAGG56_13940 [Pseudomonadota bacterium]
MQSPPSPRSTTSTDGPIAILGWGSLLWDLDDLAPKVRGAWQWRAGPRLPMEFSRISVKRLQALVLCLDPAEGQPCATHAIASIRTDLAQARTDLAARERAPLHRIGWATPDGPGESRLPEIPPLIASWCRAQGWKGAVWTDLEPNFADQTGDAFTLPRAITYLQSLEGASLAEAHRYIRQAPSTTRTPLRRALSRNTWWRSLRNRRLE